MAHEEYPPEITKENLPKLVEKAKATRKKANRVMYAFSVTYSIIALLVLFFGFPLWGIFVTKTSPSMTAEAAFITIIASFIIFYPLFALILLKFLELGMNRVFGLKYEDWIFGECVMIVNHLNNNKTEAIKDVDSFASSLRGFLWNSAYNSRARMFSPEFTTLQNGKKQLQRMLLFSNQDLVGLFTCFGLAFIQGQDTTAFFAIKDIINEASLYGEMQSLTQRVLRRLETYPTVIAIIWGIVSTIISIILAIALRLNVGG